MQESRNQSVKTPSPAPRDLPLKAKVGFLSRPTSYAEATSGVEPVETHMAWVFLTDRHAWKLKKPVRHDFLDFSTLELRQADGEREVELNRRLAPHVYLGVVPLFADSDGQLKPVEGPVAEGKERGEVVDWLVKMRRLPAEAALDHCIQTNSLRDGWIEKLAQRLTEFYRRAPRAPLSREEYRQRLRQSVQADAKALREVPPPLPADRIERISLWMLRLIDDEPALFDQRIDQHRVVEAHGDLRPQHVYLVEPVPVIIDCLEFNADFRLLDPLDELTFFVLECERLGAGWVGHGVREFYQRAADDQPPPQLLDFYIRLRGLLRAKLAIWHTMDDTVDHHERWIERAKWYLRHIDPGDEPRNGSA